jgi:hypothetical protein
MTARPSSKVIRLNVTGSPRKQFTDTELFIQDASYIRTRDKMLHMKFLT